MSFFGEQRGAASSTQDEPKDRIENLDRKMSLSSGRIIYLFLWLLALVGFFIPVAYLPTPYNGSALYFSAWGDISPWTGIGPPFLLSAFFCAFGLFFGLLVLFKSWGSHGLTFLSGSFMIAGVAVLLVTISAFSQLDCSPCYSLVIDIDFFVVLSVQLLYMVGGARLQGTSHPKA